ncbi:MAG TPA: condensation domain-containing protein, partial [Pyrinomonadaceae bacterium]|nr:condensation domain-containing protein [Pyrinomonadaceae bacterium]
MNVNPQVANSNVAQQLAALTGAKRALLELQLMKKQQRNEKPRQTITARNLKSAPLSYNQQGLWVLNQLMPGESVYHSTSAARLHGPLDVPALKKALQAIVARHDGLRTIFQIVDGEPQQLIQDIALDVPLIDLATMDEAHRETEALNILRHEARRPFDLSTGPLIRSVIVRMRDDEHILLVALHHIVTDGWSFGILHRELSSFYEAFAAGRPSPFADLPIQYSDFAMWQRQWFEGEVYESQLAFWKKQFATMPAPLELPADHSRPGAQAHRAFRGDRQTITLPADLTRRIRSLCQKENVTLFMVLMAAYQILLHRYTGEEDIVVGTPIAGRRLPEVEDLIGLFINTLAIRAQVSGDSTVREFLNQVKQVALGAYSHQDLPFERLVKELQPERTLAQNPLFQVMFVLQSEEVQPLNLSGVTAEHFRIDHVMANFDLTLEITDDGDQLVCLFESNADLFERDTIARMMTHFKNVLEGITADPEQKISDVPLLSEDERRQLLVEWNDTKTEYPSTRSIQELFEEQAALTPEAAALIWDDGELAYRDLNARANQLARYLRERGVQDDTRVAVCMHRSPDLIVAVLAILKAGGAYVPLDPAYPETRLEFMMTDSGAPLMLTHSAIAAKLPANDSVICIDALGDRLGRQSESDLESASGADNLAYVMYTSGS